MTNLWGGTLCENIVQALARIVLARAEIRLAKAGLTAVMQVHDELVFVVPEHTVPTVTDVIRRVLTAPVPWMPGLPLACTIEAGDSYGGAK
jgi:DNA polymerase